MFLHSDIYLILAPNLFYLKILSPLLCFKFLILDEHVNKNYKSLKYPSHHFRVFLPKHFFFFFFFFFWGGHSGNAATLLFCVILAFAPYMEYIKIRVENFHLHLLIM